MDHSCCPNANVVFEGRNIIIRVLADTPFHQCSISQGAEIETKLKSNDISANSSRMTYSDVSNNRTVLNNRTGSQLFQIRRIVQVRNVP